MGASSSKHDAFSSSYIEKEIPTATTSKSNKRNKSFFSSCPTLFCPPNDQSSALNSSRHSSRHGSRHGGNSDEDDSFGSPIPDTPDAKYRIQQRKEYYDDGHDDGEEKKIAGGSFGRCNANGEVRSSRYGGLEKEESGMFPYEKKNAKHNNVNNGTNQNGGQQSAKIHDGKNAESELYAKYEICEVLGVGSTSTCHRCIDTNSGESRACKIIDKTEIDPKYQNMMDQFYMEIQTLRTLQHPNIIQLYDVYITNDKIYIIMELMSGGELFDYVVQKGTLTEEEASRIVRKVTSAMVYMHSKNVIHRDLKPENLLLAHKPRSSHDIEVKIIDFGLSKIMVDGPVANSFLGTRGYLAPEMIQRRDYTKSVDAWALGVIVFVLLCGCLPFDDDCQTIPSTPDLRVKFTLRFPRWAKDLSHSAKDLLNHLLDIDSRRRYTAEQAMEHPWVRGETASKDNLLQSPGRIKSSPGGRQSSQVTKDHVSQMVANRAIANAQRAGRSPKMHVRKTSI